MTASDIAIITLFIIVTFQSLSLLAKGQQIVKLADAMKKIAARGSENARLLSSVAGTMQAHIQKSAEISEALSTLTDTLERIVSDDAK